MRTAPARSVPLLVVEADADLQAILVDLLTEEGYQVQGVASLEEALRQVEEQTFALILAHLFVGRSPYALTAAQILRRRVQPVPVGLLLTQPLPAEAVARAGFAFVLPLPFDLEDFLRVVAATLQQPLTPEQERQAAVVTAYFAALQDEDWEALLQVCTEDVTYYPPAGSRGTSARKLVGHAALRQYAERARPSSQRLQITDLHLYARPHGVVAHYLSHDVTPEGTLRRLVTTTTFHFAGERIRPVSDRAPLVRLREPPPQHTAS